MPTYQATRTDSETKADETVFVKAMSRAAGVGALRQRGWNDVDMFREVPPGFDLPDGAEVIVADSPNKYTQPLSGIDAVGASPLITHPVRTIALGIAIGLLGYFVLRLVLTFVFDFAFRNSSSGFFIFFI